MSTKKRLISILMPVYNERAYLRRIVDLVRRVRLPAGCRREIVIVDDASTDGSGALVDALMAEHPRTIRAFHQPRNQGKGAAIGRAIAEMRGDFAIFQDADLEYDPADYPRILRPLLSGDADVVYGSRFASSEQRRVLNYHHTLGNLFLTHLSNWTTGLDLTDMETCYKAFRAEVLRSIPLRSRRFGLEPEITAKLAKRQFVVYEVPITYRGRTYAEGKKIGVRDGLEALGVIAKYWLVDDCFDERYGHEILYSLSSARNFSAWTIQQIAPHLGQRILEVGAGLGNISRGLPKKELLTLTDSDPEYLHLLESAFRHFAMVEVRKLDLTEPADFEGFDQRYDTIVCCNVLQQLADDRAALARLAGLLEPGGRLVVQVPQFDFLMSDMDRGLGHQRRYEERDLASALEGAGLSVASLQSFNSLAIIGWLVNARLLGRKTFGRLQLKAYDLLVPLLKRIEQQIPLPGLSLIGVGEKG